MIIHTTSESGTGSPVTSTPQRPPIPNYYVQSPSAGDSHGEQDNKSSTPTGYRSPTDSHRSIFSRQSRWSSSSTGSHVSGRKGRRLRVVPRPLPANVEEGEDREFYVKWWSDEEGKEVSSSCKVVVGMLVLGFLFFVTCFVIWGATKPFAAQVFIKNMTVNNFYFGEGSDLTGVPTKMLTVNCSLRMRVHNPATFIGIHISYSTVTLKYYDLTIASGQLETYYQPKKSWRTVVVNIQGSNVPLYGAGTGFVVANSKSNGVPLILDFEFRSQGDVVGKLVKTKHHQPIKCSFTISSQTTRIMKFAGDSCMYR